MSSAESLLVHDVDVLQCSADGCQVLDRHDIVISGSRIDQVRPSAPLAAAREMAAAMLEA